MKSAVPGWSGDDSANRVDLTVVTGYFRSVLVLTCWMIPMPTRDAYPFTLSAEHRSDLGVTLQPNHSVVATLAQPPRAQFTPEEKSVLGGRDIVYQWGLGIGPDPCNKLYVMHRAPDADFSRAVLLIQWKSDPTASTSRTCDPKSYGPSTEFKVGANLGVIVVTRSADAKSLSVRAYDPVGATLLQEFDAGEIPAHWRGACAISVRGDNCFATGVITA